MDELLQQIGQSGGVLVLLIPPIVQILKRIPLVVNLNKNAPVYELLSLGLGVAGAFALGLPNALITGIVAGLAAGKGYDVAVGTGAPKK